LSICLALQRLAGPYLLALDIISVEWKLRH